MVSEQTVKTVIFDFDGTIADTFPIVLDIFHRVTRRKVHLSNAESLLFRQAALRQVKGRAILRHASELNVPWWHVPFIFLLCRVLLNGRMKDVQPMPGMYQAVKTLHEQGCTLAVVSSNSTANITTFLKKEHLYSYVSYIRGSVRSSRKGEALQQLQKRNPEVFKDAVLVGDEGRDIEAAKEAKLRSIGVTWGYNNVEQLVQEKPDHIVDTAAELLDILTDMYNRLLK